MAAFLAALPALFSGWSGAAIGAGAAAAGAAATHQANKKRAKLQYQNMMLQQGAQQAQMMRQKANDERMANFQASQAMANRGKNQGLQKEMQALFDKSLARQTVDEQSNIADEYEAKNNEYLQGTVTDAPMMLGGQSQAAPEVKQAVTKAAAKETGNMRARVAALARFGALGRDRNLDNNMANSVTDNKQGLLGNQIRGNNQLLQSAMSLRPSTAYHQPAKVIRPGNDADLLGLGGGIASALGGYMLGGSLAGLAGSGAGAGAGTQLASPFSIANGGTGMVPGQVAASAYPGGASVIGGYNTQPIWKV